MRARHTSGWSGGAWLVRAWIVRAGLLGALCVGTGDARGREGGQAPRVLPPTSARQDAPAAERDSGPANGPDLTDEPAEELPPAALTPPEPLGEAPAEAEGLLWEGDKPLSALRAEATPPPGELPGDGAPVVFNGPEQMDPSLSGRPWSELHFHWQASLYWHRPLYFEEPNLERYGLKHGCLQPLVSAAHFYALVPAMPYLVLLDPPRERMYDLGFARTGTKVVRQPHRYRFRPLAAAAEAALVVGLIALIP